MDDMELLPKADSRGGQKAGVRKKTVRRVAPQHRPELPNELAVTPQQPLGDNGWFTVGKGGRKQQEAKRRDQERRGETERVRGGRVAHVHVHSRQRTGPESTLGSPSNHYVISSMECALMGCLCIARRACVCPCVLLLCGVALLTTG